MMAPDPTQGKAALHAIVEVLPALHSRAAESGLCLVGDPQDSDARLRRIRPEPGATELALETE